MIFDESKLTLGDRPAYYDDAGDGGKIHWVDNPYADTPTLHWSLERNAATNSIALDNYTTGQTALEVSAADRTTVRDLRVTGRVTDPLHLAGETTRLSGFDAIEGRHWIQNSADATDRILAIDRTTVNEYDLFVNEGDTLSRVLTSGDEAAGTINAGSLGGLTASSFVQRDGSTPLTGSLNVSGFDLSNVGGITAAAGTAELVTSPGDGTGMWAVQDSSLNAHSLEVREGGDIHAPLGTIFQQGSEVLTTASNVGFAAQNTDGVDLVAGVDAVTAGTDLAFSDDGDQTVTLSFTGTVEAGSTSTGTLVTRSGDDITKVFTIPHGFDTAPAAVDVMAASRAASPDPWVTNVTATDVTIKYASAPPTGVDNLSWYVTATGLNGLRPVSVSNSGTPILTGPDDLNFGQGLNAGDDGNDTITVNIAGEYPTTQSTATIDAWWGFNGGISVVGTEDFQFDNDAYVTQFAHQYDSLSNTYEFHDRANNLLVYDVQRDGTTNFHQNLQVNGVDVATTADDLANSGSGAAPAGAVPVADGTGNTTWEIRSMADKDTVSGDDATTIFVLNHSLGSIPGGVYVQPTSAAAMSDFRVTARTATTVEITYHSPPPTGAGNLSYDIITHA